jgi:hypothetical protein
MNKPTVLFASTTVLLAAVSLYLGWALHNERADPAASLAAPPAEHQPSSAAQVGSREPSAEAPDSRPAKAQAPSVSNKPQSARPAYRERLTNQTHREAQQAYARLELERKFPDLATALNLRPDEAGAFFDLLAKQHVSDAEFESSYFKAGGQDPRDHQKNMTARGQAHRAEQAALLGDAKIAEWDRYVNSLGARAQVRELRMLLADSDYPLRRDQYEPMVAALAAEQQRHDAEREQLRKSQRDPTKPTNEEVIEYMGERLDLIEASLARRHRIGQSHLDSEQLRRYDSMLELERRRAQIDYDGFVTVNAEAAQARDRPRQ